MRNLRAYVCEFGARPAAAGCRQPPAGGRRAENMFSELSSPQPPCAWKMYPDVYMTVYRKTKKTIPILPAEDTSNLLTYDFARITEEQRNNNGRGTEEEGRLIKGHSARPYQTSARDSETQTGGVPRNVVRTEAEQKNKCPESLF